MERTRWMWYNPYLFSILSYIIVVESVELNLESITVNCGNSARIIENTFIHIIYRFIPLPQCLHSSLPRPQQCRNGAATRLSPPHTKRMFHLRTLLLQVNKCRRYTDSLAGGVPAINNSPRDE